MDIALIQVDWYNRARKGTLDNKVKIRGAHRRTRIDSEYEIPYVKGKIVYRLQVKKHKFDHC